MERDETLKPCPFCGGEAGAPWTYNDSGFLWWTMTCDRCAMTTDAYMTKTALFAAWNRRAPDTAALTAARAEALEDAAKACEANRNAASETRREFYGKRDLTAAALYHSREEAHEMDAAAIRALLPQGGDRG